MKCNLAPVLFCSLFLLIAADASAYEYPEYLINASYSVYEGSRARLQDLEKLEPSRRLSAKTFDISSLKSDSNYALRYNATLDIPIDGNYLISQSAADSCSVILDGKTVMLNDGITKRGERTIEDLVPMKAGRHTIAVNYLLRKHRRRVARLTVEGPDLYKVDKFHWLYFGWENDHPKSWSFMGGTVVPGRRQRIQFAVMEDGKIFCPDESAGNRRTRIRWFLADDFMPSPVSEWSARAIDIRIQHFAHRILNDSATAVYSRVHLVNQADSRKAVTLVVNAGPQSAIPLTRRPSRSDAYFMYFDLTILPGKTAQLDFVARANGEASARELANAGSFDANYLAMTAFWMNRLDSVTYPVTLPNQRLVHFYKAAQIIMWESIVKASNGDAEMRGSGGNPAGYYQYDRTFSHDVPNMVDQFIRGGDLRTAKRIMESTYYQRLGRELEQNYLDAIPKYVIPYASYLQFSGDKDYFTPAIMDQIRTAARAIHRHRDFDVKGPYSGIMNKSGTLDNSPYYLLVDNFASLHGLAAYHYLSSTLGDTAEAVWAQRELDDLNSSFDNALQASMQRRKVDWYMSTLDDTTYFWKNGYDGNWIGTSLMMSTFPWDASLKGFHAGGAWNDAFDRSIEHAMAGRDTSRHGIPPGSWGAWWGSEYGSCYNAGMGLQLLFSDRYRTEVMRNLDFLMRNESAPFQWGESFIRAGSDSDWTVPSADYETWGLSFSQQALLEACLSVTTDGSLIIGRGIPDEWLNEGSVLAWKNVRINGGKRLAFAISAERTSVTLKLEGDSPSGHIIFDVPMFRGRISGIEADGAQIRSGDTASGKIVLDPKVKVVKVDLVLP